METPEPVKQEEPVSTLYQYVPTEEVILSPHVEVAPPTEQQKTIEELKQVVADLTDKSQEVDTLKMQLASLTAIIEKIPSKYKGI